MRPILKRSLVVTVWAIVSWAIYNTPVPAAFVGKSVVGQALFVAILFGVVGVFLWLVLGRKPKSAEPSKETKAYEERKAQIKEKPSYAKPKDTGTAAPAPKVEVGTARVTIHKVQRGTAKVSLEGLVISEETTTGIEIEDDAGK